MQLNVSGNCIRKCIMILSVIYIHTCIPYMQNVLSTGIARHPKKLTRKQTIYDRSRGGSYCPLLSKYGQTASLLTIFVYGIDCTLSWYCANMRAQIQHAMRILYRIYFDITSTYISEVELTCHVEVRPVFSLPETNEKQVISMRVHLVCNA